MASDTEKVITFGAGDNFLHRYKSLKEKYDIQSYPWRKKTTAEAGADITS